MNCITAGAGNVEVSCIVARSVWSANNHPTSVHTARVTVTDPHSASSKDLPYPHHVHAPPPRHSHTTLTSPNGVASVFATTRDMKRLTAQQGNFVATAVGRETYTSSVLTNATMTRSRICMKTTRSQTWSFTETVRVEVEPTSILKGG